MKEQEELVLCLQAEVSVWPGVRCGSDALLRSPPRGRPQGTLCPGEVTRPHVLCKMPFVLKGQKALSPTEGIAGARFPAGFRPFLLLEQKKLWFSAGVDFTVLDEGAPHHAGLRIRSSCSVSASCH